MAHFRPETALSSGAFPCSVAASDFNGDGIKDVVSADRTDNRLSIYLGNGNTTTTTTGGSTLGLIRMSGLSVATQSQALAVLTTTSAYLDNVNQLSGVIGSWLSRLASVSRTLGTANDSSRAAESRIRDADIASESATLVSTQILQQSAAAVLAQANQQPALALQLLRQS